MGTVFKYGDNIDTDVIVPGKYLSMSAPGELARICLEGVDPSFSSRVKKGDVLVAGKNFGSGSSREHAPISILASGISCVIAESFARIFYRNSINLGLLVLESPEAAKAIEDGDEVTVSIQKGIIWDKTKGEKYEFTPFPESIMAIIEDGGIKAHIKKSGL